MNCHSTDIKKANRVINSSKRRLELTVEVLNSIAEQLFLQSSHHQNKFSCDFQLLSFILKIMWVRDYVPTNMLEITLQKQTEPPD